MQVTLNVKRYDPEAADPTACFEEFRIEAESHFTVLDGLIKVREEVDPSLAVRCSCRASICGSCAMRVNGHAALACKTKLSTSLHDGAVSVEPMGNQRVVKDLVTDASLFWGKIRAVEPFLQPKGPEPEEEYIASNDAMLNLITPMGCIMCGACVSDCTVLEVDKNFLGPAALAKAYRFVGDPRDEADADRLSTLNEYGGAWDCTRCYECVQVCPKGVAPMDRIMELREAIQRAGLPSTIGSRHVDSFARSVARSGWLDETLLAVESWGKFNVPKLMASAPVGIRALVRGKLPKGGPLHHKRPGAKNVERIFRRLEHAPSTLAAVASKSGSAHD
ncbi:MAG: succinate dehydrogenase iron-sulfur subunit [Chloroflexota bacterium]|nr:succinate dehydrogenase iron-sulfur subunit [Chloroflexota bacterium]